MISSTVLANHVDVFVETSSVEAPNEPANFLLAVRKEDVSNYSRIGNDLLIEMKDGRTVRIQGFFAHGDGVNNLVLIEEDARFWVDFRDALNGADGVTDALVVYEPINDGVATAALIGLLGAAGIGILASSSNSGGDASPAVPSAPTFTVSGNGKPLGDAQATNDTTPTLMGTAKPGSVVTIYDNGKLLGSTTADGDGKWSFTPTEPLTDGDHELTAVATDDAGSSDPSTPHSIEVDTVVPATPTIGTLQDDVGPRKGSITVGGDTDDTRPSVSGTSEAGAQISIFDGDKLLGSTIADSNGRWTFTPPFALAEGTHQLTAVATDAAGNASTPSASFELTVDTTAPSTTVAISDADADNKPTVSGTVSEPGSTVTVTWPDGTTVQVPTDV
ncbi:Ig-like domain-containing protein, partial [Comamonas sp. NoAH]|uniref:Ig-like domain-containing protein n=1 Tax=Comamonas halotolerans TaxID=3041496 RepID=UPI0024E0C245